MWESVIVLCFVLRCFMFILVFCNHLDGEERAGCFAKFVFLASCDCCVALPGNAMGLSAVCACGNYLIILTIFDKQQF